MIRTRNNRWWRLLVAAVLAGFTSLAVTAAPAVADSRGDAKTSQACWVDLDTGSEAQCFDDADELADAVLEQTGGILLPEGTELAARGGASLLTLYPVADFYTGSNYTGTTYTYTSSSSSICTSGVKEGDFTGGANNSISSWHAYYGCAARVFDLTSQAGDQYGAYLNAATIGSGMDNRASSYRLS